MKITEIIYFGYELNLLECHLATHRPHVDRIIVAESPITVSGIPKPLFFQDNRERFAPYDVEHVIIPPNISPRAPDWKTFRVQDHAKNYYMHPLAVKGADWVLHSDTDEILDPKSFPEIKQSLKNNDWHYALHHMRQYCTYANMRMGNISVYRWVRSDQPYTDYLKHKPRGEVYKRKKGWHFHNVFSSPEELYWKVKNREWWRSEFSMANAYKTMANLGKIHTLTESDIPGIEAIQKFMLHDNVNPEEITELENLPAFMQANIDKFPYWTPKP